MIGALFWARASLLVLDHYSRQGRPIRLAGVQFVVCSLLSLATAFIIETPTASGAVAGWQALLYAGLVSVGIGYTLQVVGRRSAHPAHAAIILSLETVVSPPSAVSCCWGTSGRTGRGRLRPDAGGDAHLPDPPALVVEVPPQQGAQPVPDICGDSWTPNKTGAAGASFYCRLPSARWSRSSRHRAGVIAHAVIELEAGPSQRRPGRDDIADVPASAPVLAAIRDEVAGLGVASGGDVLDLHLPEPGSPPVR